MYMSSEASHILLSARISKETDRYRPWVEAANTALQILKTIHVDNIRKPSPLNILAQRNDPNRLPIHHGSDQSFRKPDVIFMTEEELVKVHNINATAPGWQDALLEHCQHQLPAGSVEWRQFKATAEFKRNRSTTTNFPKSFSAKLRSCRESSRYFISPQRLRQSANADSEEAEGGPGRMSKTAETDSTHRAPHGTPPVKDPVVQAGGYAAEIMSGQVMTHTHGCVIEG